jgi:hypothetical protein
MTPIGSNKRANGARKNDDYEELHDQKRGGWGERLFRRVANQLLDGVLDVEYRRET